MIVTSALNRWSRTWNRRRTLEIAVRGLPWVVAAVPVTGMALDLGGAAVAIVAGATCAIALVVMAVRALLAIWRNPARTARAIDDEQHTADLLQSAMAIESRGVARDEPLEPVVMAAARAAVPRFERMAVAPLQFGVSPAGLGTLLVATVLWFLLAGDPRTNVHANAATLDEEVAAVIDRDALERTRELLEALAKDPTASAEVRGDARKAADALAKAAEAESAAKALAAMSEASRHMDAMAQKMAASGGGTSLPSEDEAAKMTPPQLAEEMAKSTAAGEAARLASLAREALKRAGLSESKAQEQGVAIQKAAAEAEKRAMAAAAAAKAEGDEAGRKAAEAAARRLQKLGAAGERMASGDSTEAQAQLRELQRLMKDLDPASAGQRMAQSEEARRLLRQMQAEQRAAMNAARAEQMARAGQQGQSGMQGQMGQMGQMQPGQSQAGQQGQQGMQGQMGQQGQQGMQGQMGQQGQQGQMGQNGQNGQNGQGMVPGAPRPGAGQNMGRPGPQGGQGHQPGAGQQPGQGQQPGDGQGGQQAGNMPGGQPSNTSTRAGSTATAPRRDGLDVLSGHGASGTSGIRGRSPSGARAPGAFAAEQIGTPTSFSPEGAVRAIAEHSAGEHRPEKFAPVRAYYEALAEAAIRRDDIPLTRRDFIQRYFATLRNREAP